MKGSRISRGRVLALRSSGFSLVELLVVIGIITLLIAILLPVIGKARAAANRTVCLSNIRQLGTGILAYCNDNAGWFPTCAYWADPGYSQYPDDWLFWQANRDLNDSAIAKYVVARGDTLRKVLRCPADDVQSHKASLGIDPGQGPYFYSYNMNDALASNSNLANGPQTRSKLTQWRSPSQKIILSETAEQYCTSGAWGYTTKLTRRHGTGISNGNILGMTGQTKAVNVSAAFLDGHAQPIDEDFALQFFQNDPFAQ